MCGIHADFLSERVAIGTEFGIAQEPFSEIIPSATLKPFGSRPFLQQRQLKWVINRNPAGESTRFVGADEIAETTPPNMIRQLSPMIVNQLMRGEGQVALGDGSTEQMDDVEFDQQIKDHLSAKGGVTIGQPQPSLSRPTQPAAVVAPGAGK